MSGCGWRSTALNWQFFPKKKRPWKSCPGVPVLLPQSLITEEPGWSDLGQFIQRKAREKTKIRGSFLFCCEFAELLLNEPFQGRRWETLSTSDTFTQIPSVQLWNKCLEIILLHCISFYGYEGEGSDTKNARDNHSLTIMMWPHPKVSKHTLGFPQSWFGKLHLSQPHVLAPNS